MSKIPTTIAGYAILPISIPPISTYPVGTTHHLYLKPHAPKIPIPTDSRSLFVVNVPIDSTEEHFRALFSALVGAGKFESVVFENQRRTTIPIVETNLAQLNPSNKKRKRGDPEPAGHNADTELPKTWDRVLHISGSTAVVVLADEKSVEVVLKAVKRLHKRTDYPVWGAGVESKVVALGSKRYLNHQKLRYPDKAALQASVDAFMTVFNSKEEEAARLAKRQRNVPDEDGFITVTRGGRVGPARKHDAEEARRKELEKEDEKRKSMGDFYRFQGRERRKEEQGELVRQFEEDRKKVENMRNERRGRFRPE